MNVSFSLSTSFRLTPTNEYVYLTVSTYLEVWTPKVITVWHEIFEGENFFTDFKVWKLSTKVFSAKFGSVLDLKQSMKVFSTKFSLPTGLKVFSLKSLPLLRYPPMYNMVPFWWYSYTTILCYMYSLREDLSQHVSQRIYAWGSIAETVSRQLQDPYLASSLDKSRTHKSKKSQNY